MQRVKHTYSLSTDDGKTWQEITYFSNERNIIEVGNLIRDITTELRGFESRFAVKIDSVRSYFRNDPLVERELEWILPKSNKISLNIYIDDQELTSLYPFVVQDHLFFIKCDKDIPNYEDFILANLTSAKKGHTISEGKLSSKAFVEKAPNDIIELENRKLQDFGFKWELWTKAFFLYDKDF